MDISKPEKDLLKANGTCNCKVHIRPADYYCEKCVKTFCVDCVDEHENKCPDHEVFYFREKAVKIVRGLRLRTNTYNLDEDEKDKGKGDDIDADLAKKIIGTELNFLKDPGFKWFEDEIKKVVGALEDKNSSKAKQKDEKLKDFDEMNAFIKKLVGFEDEGKFLDVCLYAQLLKYFEGKVKGTNESDMKPGEGTSPQEIVEQFKGINNRLIDLLRALNDALSKLWLKPKKSKRVQPFSTIKEEDKLKFTDAEEIDILKAMEKLSDTKYKMIYISGLETITDLTVKAVADVIERNNAIKAVYICGKQVSDDGAGKFASVLKQSSSLNEVVIDGAGISDTSALKFADAISSNQKIMTFHLAGNYITDSGATALANSLKSHQTMSAFYLSGAGISDEGTMAMASVLKDNQNLSTFYLGGDNITDEGVNSLANVIKDNSYLSSLSLHGGQITDKGASIMAALIKINPNLSCVHLVGYGISDKGAKAIAQSLAGNKNINSFYLRGDSISDEGAKAVIAAASKSPSISSFLIHGNNMTDESAEVMSNALKSFSRLSSFYFSGYALTGKGLQMLAHAIKTNPFIKRAYVLGCQIKEADVADSVGRLQVRGSDLGLYIASGKISNAYADKCKAEFGTRFKTLMTTSNWLNFCNTIRNSELLNLK